MRPSVLDMRHLTVLQWKNHSSWCPLKLRLCSIYLGFAIYTFVLKFLWCISIDIIYFVFLFEKFLLLHCLITKNGITRHRYVVRNLQFSRNNVYFLREDVTHGIWKFCFDNGDHCFSFQNLTGLPNSMRVNASAKTSNHKSWYEIGNHVFRPSIRKYRMA